MRSLGLVAGLLAAAVAVGAFVLDSLQGEESTSGVTAVASETTSAAASERYAAWERVLSTYVDDEGLVDYEGLQADRGDLDEFLGRVAEADPESFASDAERKAFWINAYNAVIIQLVLERYPLESVKDVGSLFGLIGGFFKQEVAVAGREMSPDDIEHGTLREQWPMDAEIHWTLVCAAFGCPRLLQRPYTAADLDATLDELGREFLAQPRGLQIDRDENTLYLSSYFDWYEGDFERVSGTVVDYVLEFAREEDAAWIRANREALEVEIMPYDWTLNDQKNGPRSARPVERE